MKGLRFLDGFLIPLITQVDMQTRVQRQKRLQDEAKKSKPKKNRAFDYLGQEYGPPPEKGPQPQGMNEGRLIEPKLKKRKRYGNRSEVSKTIKTEKGFTNVPSMYDGKEYDEDFLTEMYKDTKTDPETGRRVKTYETQAEAEFAASRRSDRLGMKTGEFAGCPHRENGVRSDIKGISGIQVKGKKFVGVR